MDRAKLRADLHLHTSASDGALAPADMVHRAQACGMQIIAITDHDSVDGVPEAQAVASACGMTLLTGLELTAGGEEEVHLLAYGVDPGDKRLKAFLDAQLSERRDRMYMMLEKLSAMQMPVPAAETGDVSGRFMGRMNLARAMVARGYVGTVREAFDRYLGVGRPAYVPRRRIEVPQGVQVLREAGALVSLAHPGRLKMDEMTLTARLPGWAEAGLGAIEAYHASHNDAAMLRYDRLARRHGLLVTGGSDCHGRDADGAQIGDHLRGWRTVTEDIGALVARLR